MVVLLTSFIAFVMIMGWYFIFYQATFWSIVFHGISHPLYITKWKWTKDFKDYCADKLIDSYESRQQKEKLEKIINALDKKDSNRSHGGEYQDGYRNYKTEQGTLGDNL